MRGRVGSTVASIRRGGAVGCYQGASPEWKQTAAQSDEDGVDDRGHARLNGQHWEMRQRLGSKLVCSREQGEAGSGWNRPRKGIGAEEFEVVIRAALWRFGVGK